MPLTESYWPSDDAEPLVDSTVGTLLRDAAAAAPDSLALTAGVHDPARRRQWTYAELLADAERAARTLLARFEPGDHVAIWAHNIPEWVILEYAIGLAGMVLVTVNPALRAPEAKYVLEQSNAAGLFHVDSYRDQSLSEIIDTIAPDLPSLREAVSFNDWDAFLASGDTEVRLPDVSPSDPAQIQYTSGTTGFPKGARLHHRGITNNARMTTDQYSRGSATVLTPMPLFHTGGCVMAVLGAASDRQHLVLVEVFDPALVLELIESYRVETMGGVPTMLIAMMNHPDFRTRDISSLRTVGSGGAMVPPDLVRQIEDTLGCDFLIVYGQTEMSPLLTMTRRDDSIDDKGGTVGRPLGNWEVKVVDPLSGDTVSCGVEGEICARGYGAMVDYFDMPDKTAEAIDADGWLHSGDLGTMDDRGYLRITGRLKDMIIRGGENIFPAEIENRLFEHASVANVAVVGVPDETWGEQVGAVVQVTDGHTLDVSALTSFCRETLAPHKVPRLWYATDEYPLTGSGKVQKFILVEQIEKGALQPVDR